MAEPEKIQSFQRCSSKSTNTSQRSIRCTFTLADTSILRATSPSVLLGCFGSTFCSSPDKLAANVQMAADTYRQSFPVSMIDVFFSHSWHSHWFLKYAILVLQWNVVPAAVSGVLVASICTGLFFLYGSDEHALIANHVVMAAGCITTCAVLLLWQ